MGKTDPASSEHRLIEVRGFPPISQKTRNRWGTELFWFVYRWMQLAMVVRRAVGAATFFGASCLRKKWRCLRLVCEESFFTLNEPGTFFFHAA
jgi:hypothetical protein